MLSIYCLWNIYMNQLTRWNLFWSFQRILLFTTTVTSATIWWLLKVCRQSHSLKFFLFDGKFLYHFSDINFVVFLTILWNSKSVASRQVFLHEYYEAMKLDQLIDTIKGNICQKYFQWFRGLGLSSRPF